MKQPRPHGSWPSPLDAAVAGGASLRLGLPQLDRGRVTWLEGRPAEGGRQVVMGVEADGGAPRELTPAGWNVRSRVHEYGGGDYRAAGGALFFVSVDGGVFRLGRSGNAEPVAGARRDARYGDPVVAPDGRWLVVVEEEARADAEPANRLVALALGASERRVVQEDADFVSSPVFSPRGDRLAWLSWRHPDMPWDATTLHECAWGGEGPAGAARRVAGGGEESIFQPSYSPGGVLTFVSDRSGWWNLHQVRGGASVCLLAREAEFGRPQWALGMTSYGHVREGLLLCVARSGGFDRVGLLEAESARFEELALPWDAVDAVTVEGERALLIAGGSGAPPAVVLLDLASRHTQTLRVAFEPDIDAAEWSRPEAITFASGGDRRAHAFLYRPHSSAFEAPADERPPLIVKSHGGPTGAASPALRLATQYWTTRGFAVLDVDYAGSTGYGRAYRDLLRGRWGELDLDDCCAGARHVAGLGLADPARLVATGGSAGGYTTLCLLTFRDLFAAGASHYGIGDLEALARDTHKFESRYLDRLIGPWPERADLYRARSPIHHAERLARPVIFFQGLEDRVVPPAQAETMVAALAARGVPHAYVAFEGEGHGFRRAENLRVALEGELWFYAQMLGFSGPPTPAGLRVESAAAG